MGEDRERAFQLVHADNAQDLTEILDAHQPETWSAWRNLAGRTLYQVAEREDRGRCLELLRQRLQLMALVPVKVPRVEFIDKTVVAREEVVQEIVEIPVPEVHYHKTLRHVPELVVTEVPEVVEVPRRTIREELRVHEEHVSRERCIPQTIIREEPEIRRELKREEILEERPLPVELTPVERIGVIHKIDVVPEVRTVPQMEVIREYEEVPFRHNVYVPKTDVRFVDQVEVRRKDVTVQNVTEHAVMVEKSEVVSKNVTLTDTEITRNIKYVPQLPMKTEWVLQNAEPIAHHGGQWVHPPHGNTTDPSNWVSDMWYELHLLRSKNCHLAKMDAVLKRGLEMCDKRERQLRDQLARERQLRQDKERQAQQLEREVATVTHLKPLPPRYLGSPEAHCYQSPNQSTMYQSTILQESRDVTQRSPLDTSQHVTPQPPDSSGNLFDDLGRSPDGRISRSERHGDITISRDRDGVAPQRLFP
jgi:hypothetical protein